MKHIINRITVGLLATGMSLLFAGQAMAEGTAAGQKISNTASVSYTYNGGTPPSKTSEAAEFLVDRKINMVVDWKDSSNVKIVPSTTNNVLSFTVTNFGNNTAGDYFKLEASNDASDGFDMAATYAVYADTNKNGTLDSGELEVSTQELFTLDEIRYFLVVADAPDSTIIDEVGLLSTVHLKATAVTDAGVKLTPASTNATSVDSSATPDIVFADGVGSLETAGDAPNGEHSDKGTFEAYWPTLTVEKEASNGTSGYHIPGDVVTYTITVTNSDTTAAASDVVVIDSIPTNTTYESFLDSEGGSSSGCPGDIAWADSSDNWTEDTPGDTDKDSVAKLKCTITTLDPATDALNPTEAIVSFQVTIN